MGASTVPFNITLLNLPDSWTRLVRPVTSLDIFVSTSKNLHPDGLFSSEIFGIPGTDARYVKESYIDIKIEIFHPLMHKCLLALKGFYVEIMSGIKFAVFDEQLKDFVLTTPDKGSTGFAFFVQHWKDIVFVETGSEQRKERMTIMEKYKDQAMMSKVYVTPAGYRDIEIDDTGRVTSNEVNELYSKLIAIANTITPALAKSDIASYNVQRQRLQNTYNDIYAMMFNVIQGKNNLMMSKWASRKVFDSTRNVLVAMDINTNRLNDPGSPGLNNATVGILQFLKAVRPKALYYLRTGFLSEVFAAPGAPALLTDRRTLLSKRVDVHTNTYDRWMTPQGMEKVIDSYRERSIRDNPIYTGGNQYYLGLIYRGPDNTFRLIHGIDELPPERSKDHCTPITLTELFYTHCYEWANTIPALITRYPIASDRSTFPALTFLLSTIESEQRIPLDHEWQPVPDKIAYKFPIKGMGTHDAQSPHPSRLEDLGADFDGDTGSFTAVLSDDGIAEVSKLMKDKAFYVGFDGKFAANLETATIKYVLANLTGH